MILAMEWIKTIVLGVIQGITEWLPVSSTGHLLLFDALFPLQVSSACKNLFMVLIQLGSILAVVVLYFHQLNPFSPKKSGEEKRATWNLWGKILVASVPVAIVGFFLDDFIDAHLHTWGVISGALFVYGLLYVVLEKKRKQTVSVGTLDSITYREAFLIGCFQVLALVPGTSRSGSTILGAIILNFDRTVASQFSFFMAIPAMVGASLLKLVKLGYGLTTAEWLMISLGFAVAFLVSLWTIKALVSYVRNHDFSVFGWYRMALAVVVAITFSLLGR